jgi:ankyrin repeat protein
VSIIKLIVASGIDINARNGKQGSALQAAIMEGHISITGLLLESGTNVKGN